MVNLGYDNHLREKTTTEARELALWDYVKAERDREKCEPSEQQRPTSEKEDHRADQTTLSPVIIQQT